VHLVIRPPTVVPGLAEIIVRVANGDATRVTVLPVFWRAGRNGAPPPDEAKRIRGQADLYTATLWLMTPGAYCVEVNIEGAHGTGQVIVPVNAMATNTRPMSVAFGVLLGGLALVLLVGAVRIVGAAFAESVLAPDATMSTHDRLRGRVAMAGGLVLFTLVALGGKKWWDVEASDYRNNRLYKAARVDASMHHFRDQDVLALSVDPVARRGRWTPLIPDHGKIMHLFLVEEADPGAFAHLHPLQRSPTEFVVALPALPAGEYQLYADVTHEDGFAETLTAAVTVPSPQLAMASREASQPPHISADPDDSWLRESEQRPNEQLKLKSFERAAQRAVDVGDGYIMLWENFAVPVENRETALRFKLIPPPGHSAAIEPYMGMSGHAAVRRSDGAVFAHIHPAGNFSMASQQFFERDGPARATQEPDAHPVDHSSHLNGESAHTDTVSFPYEFPKPGRYRLWVQMKCDGKVMTGVFDTDVTPGS
jgi:hypothetical protein